MKNRNHIQQHPRQEDKTGKATFASYTGINSSTNGNKPSAGKMPNGEGECRDNLLKSSNKKMKSSLSTMPKQ